ncbi:MAG: alanine--tRNA ligase [Nitrospinota bacterium]
MSEKLTGSEIRRLFLDYFASKNHRQVRSSSLIPAADPTLLFTNAGMVPFKDVFLGDEKRDYKRAASSQKCLRVSGKHNDLEEVGRTTRHNTFFEMLGNFSFGDYFKEGAIEYAWEFLTETVKLPKETLWVTVFEEDDEAEKLWVKVTGIKSGRIIRMGEKENFWAMGPTGPCGPCSEIHIDYGKGRGCGKDDCDPSHECGRFEELWNLVFMQFNRGADGKMEPLPKPNIDTGMGLERLASLLQNVESNFDTDLIRPVMARAEDVLEKPYGDNTDDDVSFRVIGDHSRAAAFLISEGILPSNDDRGYVLRRIMRRAMRHGRMLGAKEPFLYKVVGSVIDLFKGHYPELIEAESTIAKIVKVEEQRFERTLETGLGILNAVVERAKSEKRASVAGREVFKLYDTYGFPLDLANDVITDAGLTFDMSEFNRELENQREKARKSFKGQAAEIPKVYKEINSEPTFFTGYKELETESAVSAIVTGGVISDSISKGQKSEVILDKTPFYAESGGQAGDRGTIVSETGSAKVVDTKKVTKDIYAHLVEVTDGEIKTNQKVSASVNADERASTVRNHSATHLLQAALRQVLGDHVKQSGSLVNDEKLRFDFSHYAAMTHDEIREAEEIVNTKIREDLSVTTEEMDLEKALDGGATALFGEKYTSTVRVVGMGDFSKELCGGTHAKSTGQIGVLKVVSETGVAAGVRRIEAITGQKAFDYFNELEGRIKEVAALLKGRPEDSADKVRKLVSHNKELEKAMDKMRADMARGGDDGSTEERDIKGVKVVSRRFEGMDPKALRNYVDEMKVKMKSGVVLAGTVKDGKAALVAGVTKDLTDKLKAGEIVKRAAAIVGGKGGGRPDMAQAGGNDAGKLDEALQSVFASVEEMLGK